jgi:hypothetical protein
MAVDGCEIASIGRIIYVHSQTADRDALRRLFRYYSGLDLTDKG